MHPRSTPAPVRRDHAIGYNVGMASDRVGRRFFSLREACELLPTVKRLTAEAVRDAEVLVIQLQQTDDVDPKHESLSAELDQVVARWTKTMQEMSLKVKGLWLVDFDNGEGYYCWCYPEDGINHYHGYAEGFSGRLRIM
jgi:hypothetical protein